MILEFPILEVKNCEKKLIHMSLCRIAPNISLSNRFICRIALNILLVVQIAPKLNFKWLSGSKNHRLHIVHNDIT